MHNSQIEQLVRLNTVSPILLSKYVVRSMMADGGGRIVNLASIVAFTGYSGLSVYGATKASMIGFTRSLAREVGRLGVTVNAVAPGFVDTEMTQGLAEEHREQIARRSALRRFVEVDDVAAAVEYLLGRRPGTSPARSSLSTRGIRHERRASPCETVNQAETVRRNHPSPGRGCGRSS